MVEWLEKKSFASLTELVWNRRSGLEEIEDDADPLIHTREVMKISRLPKNTKLTKV